MMKPYKNILVPIDGSKESQTAFIKAIKLANKNKLDALKIVHVIDTRSFQNVAAFDTEIVEQASQVAHDTLIKYVNKAKESGLPKTTYSIEYGSPKYIIAHDLPNKFNTDLIIMGANGLNKLERVLIGSVASYVIKTSDCDVLIAKKK